MIIEKTRLKNLRKQIPDLLKQNKITIEGNVINCIGHKYKYETIDGIICIECNPFFKAMIQDNNKSLEIIEVIENGKHYKSDRILNNYVNIISILYVVMENLK